MEINNAVLNCFKHQTTQNNFSGYEINHQRSATAGHGEFQALPSDFLRAGYIYPKMEDDLCGTRAIKWFFRDIGGWQPSGFILNGFFFNKDHNFYRK